MERTIRHRKTKKTAVHKSSIMIPDMNHFVAQVKPDELNRALEKSFPNTGGILIIPANRLRITTIPPCFHGN
uniref:Uncharacterized protein n=1 Tax=Candidatus Kentrum sp. TUN TaxID=2126343 RepID=A0A450ZKB7_9GAMM|nr:MAG: hypothetical protein BECKTUN1418F_GA0071002_10398 [Candidatus Kentron sp. TUN]VFK56327.1 MAG: hypothetical protein BECKTUN1418E_GA0071001_10408 [Candidatus Kentron sp. TUN]